jgi:hypothetical protein
MGAGIRVRWLLVAIVISMAAQSAGGGLRAHEDDPHHPAGAKDRNWDVAIFLGYGSRSVDGTIIIDRPGPGSGIATAQSLGLGQARDPQFAIDGRWKRLHLGLDFVPTTVEGQGFALANLQLGNVGISFDTPVSTNIDVNLNLFTVRYAVVQNRETTLNVGVGLGRTSLDIAMTPEVGQPISTNSHTPFGFLAVELGQRFGKRWSMSFAAHGASIATNGDEIDYFDFNVGGGYRAVDRGLKLDVVAGFRLINFVGVLG